VSRTEGLVACAESLNTFDENVQCYVLSGVGAGGLGS